MSPNVLQELRVVGVEDGGFTRKRQGYAIQKALFVCVLLRGNRVKDFQAGMITIDDLDATEKLTATLQRWSFDAVILAGVSFAGFKLVDPTIIYEEFRKPVIVISRTKPNNVAVKTPFFGILRTGRFAGRCLRDLVPFMKLFRCPLSLPFM